MDSTDQRIADFIADATILELRLMLSACDVALQRRSFVCTVCGGEIPTARPLRHPAHATSCLRYASMVSY